MSRSHNTGAGNQIKHTRKYYDRNHHVINRERKANRLRKFLAWCRRKWVIGTRIPRGTERARRRKEKREGKTLQKIK